MRCMYTLFPIRAIAHLCDRHGHWCAQRVNERHHRSKMWSILWEHQAVVTSFSHRLQSLL